MKRVLLVSMGLIFAGGYIGCLPEGGGGVTGAAGTTGTAGTGAAGTTGVAGTQGTAGDTGVAGTSGTAGGTGGDPQGVAGTTGGAGPQGTAGTAAGGTTGSAGSGGAGAGPGGRGGAAGTAAGGTGGGAAGRGGAAGTGTGGTGGSAPGGTGGARLPTIPELFPTSGSIGSFDGRLVVMPCGDANPSGTDCGGGGAYYSTAGSSTATRIACSGPLNVNQVFYVGGEMGKLYDVTVHFYGIAEPKVYGSGITREAGTGRPATTTSTTGAGATPTAWATAPGGHTFSVSDYNTNEIRVCKTRACAAADETNVYYLNADTGQGHWTFVLNYEKHITVVGGGAIRVRNFDQNCRQIKNCGPDGTPANQCATMSNRRVIDLSAASPRPSTMPAAMGGLLQPQLVTERDAASAGQWLLIDVVSVNSVQ